MISLLKKYPLLLAVTALFLLAGCEKEPQFSPVPHITFKETATFLKTDATGFRRDSVIIAINFEDGDGNLGLAPSDTAHPFDFRDGQNKYFNNFFTELLIKRNGEFEPFPLFFPYIGRFPVLAPDFRNGGATRTGTLEGEIRFAVVIYEGSGLNPGDIIKFRNVHIVDRALNESNYIETDEIELFTP
jgi:hypothetical protein